MKTDTRDQIVNYLKQHSQASPSELQIFLGIGAPALFRQLKKLQESGQIAKAGSSPKVFYYLSEAQTQSKITVLEPKIEQVIQDNFFTITPLGNLEEGVKGFEFWCAKQALPIEKTAREYVQTLAKYQSYKKKDLIDGMDKLKTTFAKVFLDELYYLDFYSIERFGKTKLGNILLYAKQSQSQPLMRQLFDLIRPRVRRLLAEKKIEAVGFVPPTISRNLQLQKEMEKSLDLGLPTLKISKAGGMIAVAQKTLNKLADRIENASSTIFVENIPNAKRILLIDDAVGTGASLNETARKIKEKRPEVKVIGLAVTGSFKGFEVLNEV